MDNFFQVRNGKCASCALGGTKKNTVNFKLSKNIIKKEGSGEILIIFEMPEPKDFQNNFEKLLKNIFPNGYTLQVGIECQTKKFEIPSPMNKVYKTCNVIEKNSYYKAIITVGRGIMSITQNEDLVSWEDFAEYKFNPTYFYTHIGSDVNTRVYPIPPLFTWVENNADNFEKYFTELQLRKVAKWVYSDYELEPVAPYNKVMVEDPNKWLIDHMCVSAAACDIEANSLDVFREDFEIICLTIALDETTGYYLPFDKIDKTVLMKWFLSVKILIWANGAYDISAFHRLGMPGVPIHEDVTLLFHLLYTERLKNGIKSTSWLLGLGNYDEPLSLYKDTYQIKDYSEIPLEILFDYAAMDPIVTFRLYNLGRLLARKQRKVYSVYRDRVIPAIPVAVRMKMNGMHLDLEYMDWLNHELIIKGEKLRKEINEILPRKIDIGSAEQLARVLEEMGLPDHGKTKKGVYCTGWAPLQTWKSEGYSIAGKILEYRSTTKLNDAFIGEVKGDKFFGKGNIKDGYTKFLKFDGLLHADFNMARTTTYRSTCNGPNLQQGVKHGGEGRLFRPIFKCPEDFWIWEMDYIGFQLRIAAIFSGDKMMKRIFLELGGDMHSITAQAVFARHIPIEEFLQRKGEKKFKVLRQKAKNQINFPLLFSSSPYVIYGTIENEWTEEERVEYINNNNLEISIGRDDKPDTVLTVCVDIRQKFLETYASLWPWIESQHNKISDGYVDSILGARRHLPRATYIGKDTYRKEVNNLKNIGVNAPVQTFEALTAMGAMKRIDDELQKRNHLKSTMNFMVHDSIGGYMHKNEVHEMWELLKIAEDHTSYEIPLLTDLCIGKVWGFSPEITEKDLDRIEELNAV